MCDLYKLQRYKLITIKLYVFVGGMATNWKVVLRGIQCFVSFVLYSVIFLPGGRISFPLHVVPKASIATWMNSQTWQTNLWSYSCGGCSSNTEICVVFLISVCKNIYGVEKMYFQMHRFCYPERGKSLSQIDKLEKYNALSMPFSIFWKLLCYFGR